MTITNYIVRKTSDIKDMEGFVMLPVSRNDGKKGKSGIAIQLPEVSESVLSLVFSHPDGKAFITDAIDSVRSKIASAIYAKGEVITSDKIGIDSILAMMKQASENQRMTKDAIGNWFDSDLLPLLQDAIKAKLAGISADKLEKFAAGYRADFQSLASRNVIMSEEIKTKLTKAIALLPDDYDSVIGEKVITALNDLTVDIGDVL
jgi:hypothetical protein